MSKDIAISKKLIDRINDVSGPRSSPMLRNNPEIVDLGKSILLAECHMLRKEISETQTNTELVYAIYFVIG